MTTALAARSSNVPLPTGTVLKRRGVDSAAPAWPGPENFLYGGPSLNAETGVFRRPERFWLAAGASIIESATSTAAWLRVDYELRLVVNGAYGNDLNGINFFQKATAAYPTANSWQGVSIEGKFFCEANTDYNVYLLSKSNTANAAYYQAQVHWNMWGYTIGEGAV